MQKLILILALSTFTLASWDWGMNYCESWSCRHSYDECWYPSCGLESYATNRDFFTYYFRDNIMSYDLDHGYANGLYKKMKKYRRNRIRDFGRQLKEISFQTERLGAFVSTQGDLYARKIRDSILTMNKYQDDYLGHFDGYSYCNGGLYCHDSYYHYFVASNGNLHSHGNAHTGYDNHLHSHGGYLGFEGHSHGGHSHSHGGDHYGYNDAYLLDNSGYNWLGYNGYLNGNFQDHMVDLMYAYDQGSDIMGLLRNHAHHNVGTLSLFLGSYHDDDMRNSFLYHDFDCGSSCLGNYNDLYIIWNDVFSRLRTYYTRKIVHLDGCGRRRTRLRSAFENYCSGYSSSIRAGLLGYYDYLINWDGCGDIIW